MLNFTLCTILLDEREKLQLSQTGVPKGDNFPSVQPTPCKKRSKAGQAPSQGLKFAYRASGVCYTYVQSRVQMLVSRALWFI